jgi:hypothetical protein
MSLLVAIGTQRRLSALHKFGSDRSKADMLRAVGACRADESDAEQKSGMLQAQ